MRNHFKVGPWSLVLACAQGREGEALALYDSITLSSAPARASR